MNNETLMYYLKKCEEKLKELMPEDEFTKFITDLSKEGFAIEISKLPDSGFKQFCIVNFNIITGDGE